MIANEFQYNLTRTQITRFEQALQQLDGKDASTGEPLPPLLQQLERNALQSQLDSLRTELTELSTD